MTALIKGLTRRWIREKVIEKSDADIYEYGLELLVYSIINLIAIIGSSIIIGRVSESLVLLATIIPLQSFGGGFHAKTHLRCFSIMYIGWWVFILTLPLITPVVASAIVALSEIIIFSIAPITNENVKMSEFQIRKMRRYVRIIAVVGAVTGSVLHGLHIKLGIVIFTGLGISSLSMVITRLRYASNIEAK